MNIMSWIMAIFALIGAFDYIIGNKIGVGKEFEKGIQLLGTMMLSMVGMLVLAPLFSTLLERLIGGMTGILDPSVIPALLFANDMGGASMSMAMANDVLIGKFSGLVVSSMMGVTFSFTLPYALGVVKKEQHNELFFGFLCGIVTIPFGCIVGGIILGVPFLSLIINLLPLIIICIVIAIGLLKMPNLCVKVFSILGVFIKILVVIGLAIGIFETVTGLDVIPYTATIAETGQIILNIACVLAGAFPLMNILSRILKKPMAFFGKKIGINVKSTAGIISSVVSSATAFGMMDEMDEKGVTINAAFSISGSFIIGSHLAFTLAFSPDCLFAVIIGKLFAGILAIIVAEFFIRKKERSVSIQC